MSYTKKHIIAIILGLIFAVTCAVLSKTYRPYIYTNHINDFHLADTIPNWLALPSGTLFFWGLHKGCNTFKKGILCAVVGIIVYEFILSATFDWYDIIATILSGSGTYFIYLIYKYFQSKKL
jgi:hypothetical protein